MGRCGLGHGATAVIAGHGFSSAHKIVIRVAHPRVAFARALDLPTFSIAGMTLLKRMALVIDDGVIDKVFYPVFPPDQNAAEVVAWLRGH